jgi:hypothetical protein
MKRQVDVKLVVYVKGQLTELGDVRELEPIVQATINGAAAGFLQWTKDAAMSEDEHCGFDYSVQLSSTARKPRKGRAR